MADWDLLTPGIGLTSIGIVGVFVSLSGIAKTFFDGMHAVSLLTLLIGLLFLTPGIFKDGFPSSRKAKVGSFITLGILVITRAFLLRPRRNLRTGWQVQTERLLLRRAPGGVTRGPVNTEERTTPPQISFL